jgi:ubiquinone/menaquinone biosynthesis C-methylase UbiE
VAEYDRRHAQFRDVEEENRMVLAQLSLPFGSRVLDIGAGTGHFVRTGARAGLHPTAVDISHAMLGYSREESEKDGLSGIDHIHAGFLSLDFPEATFDAVHTSAALHHLPDVWKAVALEKIHRILKPAGQFLLRDVVFDWGETGHAAYFNDAVQSLSEEMRPLKWSAMAWALGKSL